MRLRYSETCANYGTYTFGWAVYAKADSPEEVPELYSAGFLPYSDRRDLGEDIFYKARSLRIDLEHFRVARDERYAIRKMDEIGVEMEVRRKQEVIEHVPSLREVCLHFASVKFHECQFDEARLEYILNRPYLTDIAVFTRRNDEALPLGFAFLVETETMVHVWYSFARSCEETAKNFGKYVLVRILEYAQARGKQYCYLGTCYGTRSAYKAGFSGVEFYDGRGWITDRPLLSRLQQSDDRDAHTSADLYKQRELSLNW